MALNALTVCVPWPHAIMHGKDIENRSWYTPYRGLLVIHAGKSTAWLNGLSRDIVNSLCSVPLPEQLTLGAIIGVVELFDCVSRESTAGQELMHNNPWASADSNFYWRLRNPRALKTPIPYKGAQGLFRITEPTIVRAVNELISAV